MGEINAALGGHGAGRECHGFTFFYPKFSEKAKFESWLEDSARKEITQWKGILDPDDFTKQVAARGVMLASFAYSWGAGQCMQALSNAPGKIRLLAIVASRKNGGNLTTDLLTEVAEAYYQHQEEFDEVVEWMKAAGRPNGQAGT